MHVALAISVMRYKRTLVRAGGRRMTLDVRVLSNYLLSAFPRGICPSRGNVASTMQCPQWPQSFTQRCTSHITVSQPLTHPCIALHALHHTEIFALVLGSCTRVATHLVCYFTNVETSGESQIRGRKHKSAVECTNYADKGTDLMKTMNLNQKG